MKATKVIDYYKCDNNCPNEAYNWDNCLGCGRIFCSTCKKIYCTEFHHAVYFQGSYDGLYCHKCIADPTINTTKLFKAFAKIEQLRNDYLGWQAGFEKRRGEAEEELKKINPR